jgi:hypothetical protein
MQHGGGKAGGALRLSVPGSPSVVIPGSLSARLNRCLKPNTGHRLLRFSILKETPAAPQTAILFCDRIYETMYC